MFKRTKLACAITAATTATAVVIPANSAEIEEIIVTSTKRAESAQDIPVTIQALDTQALIDLNIGNFDDYIRYLAGVNSAGRGPGRNNIYIRGVSTGKGGVKIAGAVGSEPNVALYLDEAPISMGGRNIDAYMTDMSRIEVLPGPQGTLFGASSQAGTVRLITNKPDFEGFDVGFDVGFANTSGGETSNNVEAHVNIPLIENKLAVRAAVYNVKQGGYIDNVLGTKQIALTNPAFSADPLAREIAVNNALAEEDFNDATFEGFRGGIMYAINDDWDVLIQHWHQDLETEGVFDFDPTLGDLKVQTFSPDNAEDDVDHTSWTVTGRAGALDLVYTGSYLDRVVDVVQDYSGYADVGPFIPYYICEYPGYATCGSPVLFVRQFYGVERNTHEFRFSTDPANRLRVIAGIFYDDSETIERGDWNYIASIEQGFDQNSPFPTATSSNPDARPPGVTFFNDYTRKKEELSFFGEVSFDITDALTATIGLRHYDIEIALNGSSNFGQKTEGDAGNNIDERLAASSPADFDDDLYKFNLQWQINDDVMIYGTWSEGYRAGGFNRNGGATNNPGVGPFIPDFYDSDDVTNLEFGWKTSLLDGSLQFNGAAYSIEWDRMQVAILDFSISNLTFLSNAADAEIKGVEVDAIWAPTDELTVFANVSFNDTELTFVPSGIVSLSPEGSQLAQAPELQYTMRGRYNWELEQGGLFTQLAYQYTDSTPSSIVLQEQFEQGSYNTLDFALGYERDEWTATLFVENLTDERAELFINQEDDIVKTATNRPRTYGVRFSYRYGR